MEPSKDFKKNLKNKFISEEMFFECLRSLDGRIKNGEKKVQDNSTDYTRDYAKRIETYNHLKAVLSSILDYVPDKESVNRRYKAFSKKNPYKGYKGATSLQFVRKVVGLIQEGNYTLWTGTMVTNESVPNVENNSSAVHVLANNKSGKYDSTTNRSSKVCYAVCDYFTEKQSYIEFTPDISEKAIGSYEHYQGGSRSNPNTGKYRISGNMIKLIGDFIFKAEYQIDGKYLIQHSYDIPFDVIPEGDIFDAEVKDDKHKYIFKKDGSFEYFGFRNYTGRYERKGDFLVLKYDNGDISGALVKDGYFNNGAYVCEESLLE